MDNCNKDKTGGCVCLPSDDVCRSSSNTLMVVESSGESGDMLGAPMKQIMKVLQTGPYIIVQLRPYHHLNRAGLVPFSSNVRLSVHVSISL